MTLQIDDIVRVNTRITPASIGREFGGVLFLTQDTTLDATGDGKVRQFSGTRDVESVFEAGAEPLDAATVYFQQRPYPQDLLVGRWVNADKPSTYTGTGTLATLTAIQAITAGTLDGTPGIALTGLDFSGASAFGGVATTLQTAIQTVYSTATVTYDSATPRHFAISVPPIDGEPVAVPSSFTGTAAALLGLDSGAVVEGEASETLAEALTAIQAVNNDWYFVAHDKAVGTTSAAQLATWAATSGDKMAGIDVTESESPLPAIQATERAYVVWSRTADYKALSLASRLSSVDFARTNSLITGKFQGLPGTAPDSLTSERKQELDDKRLNYYTRFGDVAIVAEGVVLQDGVWIDVRYWLDWITNAIQREVFDLLHASPARITQTGPGLAVLQDGIERVCEAGRRNGGIAAGQLPESIAHDIRRATGSVSFDGFLSRGYLVHMDDLATQPQRDREARIAPPFRVWLKGSGAVHFVNVELTFLS